MTATIGTPTRFPDSQAEKLLALLSARSVLPGRDHEAIVHALTDIAASVEKVYGEMLPVLLSDPTVATEALQDTLWDIREEFRHIQYHIDDGALTDL